MAYVPKEGMGSLFKVMDENRRENGPDYEGRVMVGGQEYRLAGWAKTSANGVRWLSLKAELPREAAPKPAAKKQIDPDEDIPF
jgi:uncharacterized protein (DUF736 family)